LIKGQQMIAGKLGGKVAGFAAKNAKRAGFSGSGLLAPAHYLRFSRRRLL
jgi:hypothetical protein